MFVFLLLIGIYVFFKTISYGIYEIKMGNNKPGGITVIVLGIISTIFPIIIMLFN